MILRASTISDQSGLARSAFSLAPFDLTLVLRSDCPGLVKRLTRKLAWFSEYGPFLNHPSAGSRTALFQSIPNR